MGDLFYIPGSDPLAKLRKLVQEKNSTMEIGKAAEHLVVADLLLQGYQCYLSDQALPYDLVVDHHGTFIRIQCKAACFPRNVNAKGKSEKIAYTWNVRRRGKFQTKRLSAKECQVVALVAVDVKQIAYFPIERCGQTMQIAPNPQIMFTEGQPHGLINAPISSFTFEWATKGLLK